MDSFVEHGIDLGVGYMLMEQVPTLLQPQNAEHLDHLRELLFRAGYSMVEPQILRAIDFGVPQRRERVFLLIHRNDRAAPEYPQPTHGEADDFFLHPTPRVRDARSEEHTSELQSLMRISYAVFCLQKNKHTQNRD